MCYIYEGAIYSNDQKINMSLQFGLVADTRLAYHLDRKFT